MPESYRPEISHGKGFETYSSWWEPSFKYFDRPTDPRGHWIVIRMLASAARSLKTYDPILASQCLHGAKRVWKYMQEKGEHVEDFDWEIYPPMGHGNFREVSFSYYYKNSTWMLCSRAAAAVELYAAEPNEIYKERAVDALDIIASRMVKDEDGALHLVDYKTDRLTRAEEKSYVLTRKKMNDAHSEQLSYYSEAIYRMFGRRPVTVQVYSTVLGRLVDIDTSVSFDKK